MAVAGASWKSIRPERPNQSETPAQETADEGCRVEIRGTHSVSVSVVEFVAIEERYSADQVEAETGIESPGCFFRL